MRSTTKKMTSSFGTGRKKTYTVKITVYVFFCFIKLLQSLYPPCRHTLGSAFSSFIYAYLRMTLKFEVVYVPARSVPEPTSPGRCGFSPAGSVGPRTNVPRTLWDVLHCYPSQVFKTSALPPRYSDLSCHL